jgi:hypothetical protein
MLTSDKYNNQRLQDFSTIHADTAKGGLYVNGMKAESGQQK